MDSKMKEVSNGTFPVVWNPVSDTNRALVAILDNVAFLTVEAVKEEDICTLVLTDIQR